MTDTDHTVTKGLVAKNSGFSLHAGVATFAHERDRLERVCRYIARPAISVERLSTDDYGNVIYRYRSKATGTKKENHSLGTATSKGLQYRR